MRREVSLDLINMGTWICSIRRPGPDSDEGYRCNSDNSLSEAPGSRSLASSNSNEVFRKSTFRIGSRNTIGSLESTVNGRFSSIVQNLRQSLTDLLLIFYSQ